LLNNEQSYFYKNYYADQDEHQTKNPQ